MKLLNDLLFMTRECIRIVKADVKFFISTKLHHYLRNLTTAKSILHSSSYELELIDPYTTVILVVIFTY